MQSLSKSWLLCLFSCQYIHTCKLGDWKAKLYFAKLRSLRPSTALLDVGSELGWLSWCHSGVTTKCWRRVTFLQNMKAFQKNLQPNIYISHHFHFLCLGGKSWQNAKFMSMRHKQWKPRCKKLFSVSCRNYFPFPGYFLKTEKKKKKWALLCMKLVSVIGW